MNKGILSLTRRFVVLSAFAAIGITAAILHNPAPSGLFANDLPLPQPPHFLV